MIVVSDTSALTSLLQVGQVHLLEQMYGTVFVPSAVEKELRVFHGDLPAFVISAPAHDKETVARLLKRLDQGEAEAITLAKELKASALLIDEKRGRAVAIQEGLRVIGLAGVLRAAKLKGLILSLTALLDELEAKADFRMADTLKAQILRSVGE